MSKQYKFLILLWIFFFVLYLVANFTIKSYQISQKKQWLIAWNQEISERIMSTIEETNYKTTRAYKNKLLKSEQWRKSKWEKVLYITTESDYNKFTQPYVPNYQEIEQEAIDEELDGLSNPQKWKLFLFWSET